MKSIPFMLLKRKMTIRLVMLVILQWCCYYTSFATNDPVITKPLLGSRDSVKVNMESSVMDISYFSPSRYIPVQELRIKNLVSVGLEEESTTYIQSDFTVTVKLHIIKYDKSNVIIEQLDKDFTINYKKADTAKYNAKNYYTFKDAYSVNIKIVSIDSGSVTWPVSKVLRVDNMMSVSRDYGFNCSAAVPGLTVALDEANGELTAQWGEPMYDGTYKNGQTEFDLEWTWIDESAINDYRDNSGNFIPEKLFTDNATRVSITSFNYNIPLLYDGEGRVFVRVRPVQLKIDGQRIEGEWTWRNASSPVYYAYGGHENSLNWQASTSFAEEGKRKSVVQYFDGTLRNRQTVTKDNTTNTTVVAESFYDYQGRPVIQLLPSPTLNTIISYSQNFNKAVDFDGYPKWAYDKLDSGASVCANPALAFSTATGTSRYYSPDNELVNEGYNKFIPDAHGYPFSETRFTPDGRVAAQGGVGPTHQLGSSHETKYMDESVAQEELDALFGTDAGYASHYFKNLVRDANGQYSVSYTDMHGRTVATALAGDAPKNPDGSLMLDTLESHNTKNFTKQLIDEETNRVIGRSIISTKTLVATKAGLYKFDYSLSPEQLSILNCATPAQPVCYDCLYQLKFTITSDCNNLAGFTAYVDSSLNFTLGQYINHCNEDGKAAHGFSKHFELTLPEGTYTVTKTLSLSDSAQMVYRDVFIANDTCKKFIDFYNEEYQVLLSKSNCNLTCESCKAAMGATFAVFRSKFVTESGMQEPLPADIVTQLEAAYADGIANCQRICNGNVDDGMDIVRNTEQLMLMDMTPPNGQYAKPEDANKLYNIFGGTINNEIYRNPKNYTVGSAPVPGKYLNEFGLPEDPDPSKLGKGEFTEKFQPSWAEQLLPYHPEFCKLKATKETLSSAYHFEATLNKTNTWLESKTAQFTTVVSSVINIINKDSFFMGPGSGLRSTMLAKLNAYDTVSSKPACVPGYTLSFSMWQIAQASVLCRNLAGSDCDAGSDQNQCLISTPTLPPTTPSTGCLTDWDMMWKNFRSLYLSERRKLISTYLESVCQPAPDLVLYQKRFVDLNSNTMPGVDDGDLTGLFNEINSGNNDNAVTIGHGLMTAMADSACRGYANSWIAQLEECPAVGTISSEDSTWLVTKLVAMCKLGADENHMLGSGSIKPGDPAMNVGDTLYKEFPDIVKMYLKKKGIIPPLTELCHPYLITSPKPYDKQPVLTPEYVVAKPTECECQRLQQLKFDYANEGFTGTFRQWLAYRHGTVLSQGIIDTLTTLCDGTYPCNFLVTPIKIPPILQCSGGSSTPPKTCIDCGDYAALKDSFYVIFDHHAPIANPQSDTDINWNIAFEQYANHRTGFSKSWTDYVAFGNTCDSTIEFSCHGLDSVLNLFNIYIASHPSTPTECRQHFVDFFNAAYNVNYTFQKWMQIFMQSCGHQPPVCAPTVTCKSFKVLLKNFYDIYGVQVYKNLNCQLIFTNYINGQLQSSLTYEQIDTLYHSACGVGCALDVCSFPNSFLLTRAYNKFRADSVLGVPIHENRWCQESFIHFFNSYFGLDTAWSWTAISNTYATYHSAGCAPDLNVVCIPEITCSNLHLVLQRYYDAYPSMNCDTFVVFFNQQLNVNYSQQQINELFATLCNQQLPCAGNNLCSEMLLVWNDFVVYSDSTGVPTQDSFPPYFNMHFGTSYTSYDSLANYYYNHCGIAIKGHESFMGRSGEPIDCDAIMQVLSNFNAAYPDPYTQLAGNCDNVFAAYFNANFDTRYTYSQIQAYYMSLCSYTLDVCNTDCSKYITFVNDFNSHYGSLQASLLAKKQLFAFLFNKAFNNDPDDEVGGIYDPGAGQLSYAAIVEMIDSCIAGDIVTGSETVSLDNPQALLDMKQVYYLLHPEGLPGDCGDDFTGWFNLVYTTGGKPHTYTFEELFTLYETVCGEGQGYICGPPAPEDEVPVDPIVELPTLPPPLLCGLNEPVFDPQEVDENPCKDLPKLAYTAALEKWELYVDSLRNVFDTAYYNKCMAAGRLESFTVNYDVSEYHYTLYYYDQAGNLVKTVPPAGVDAKHGDATFLANVKTKRLNVKNGQAESSNILTPTHTLFTEYRYNTLNQVVAQKTPDAGVSNFWYDRLGRLVISQNAKQQAENKYSYTLYDELGRIQEVAQVAQTTAMTQDISRNAADAATTGSLANWLDGKPAEQITRTVYDKTYYDGDGTLSPQPLVQRNLRNRVSYSAVYATGTPGVSSAGSHTSATFYTYDIHGNVDTLLQDYNDGVMKDAGNRFKKIVYDYDLISGKVNDVAYQPGCDDAFYHHYEYDAENRLTEVYTSQGKYGRHIPWWAGGLWEKDARYTYYKHGPLARMVLGQQQVQGVDYAYTLQGWLKGVNDVTAPGSCAGAGMMADLHVYDRNANSTPSAYHASNSITFEPGFTSNTPDNFVGSIESSPTPCDTAGGYVLSDMGSDGDNVARDAYSFNLNYFSNDYKPISSTATVGTPAPLPGTTGSSLYNGNISSMAVNIPKLGDAHLYGYRYDQLNRITAMDAFTGLNTTSNIWTPVATDNYKERVSYNANGNIKTYKRNGDAARLSMDDMTYHYKPNTNQLDKVTDAAPDAASGVYDKYNDIKQGQSNGNYQYDAIGNVISDASEGITDINWNVYGKIESITKSSGTITYTYDASGNRISKTANSKTTWYARDASGNVMSVYTKDNAVNGGDLTQSEAHLYGSSRLGIFNVNRNVEHPVEPEDGMHIFTRGNKFFELSNHLGNVWLTVSDRKDGVDINNDGIIDYYVPHVVNANDYYPFGMQMPGRRYADNGSYRYGFNGKEKSDEIYGEGNIYDYGFRIYNPRLGKFLSVDPLSKSYPWNSCYSYAEGDPVNYIDLDGAEKSDPPYKENNVTFVQMFSPFVSTFCRDNDKTFTQAALAVDTKEKTEYTINAQQYEMVGIVIPQFGVTDNCDWAAQGQTISKGEVVMGRSSPGTFYTAVVDGKKSFGKGDPPANADFAIGGGIPVIINGLKYGEKNIYIPGAPANLPEVGDPGEANQKYLVQRSNAGYPKQDDKMLGKTILASNSNTKATMLVVQENGLEGMTLTEIRDKLITLGYDNAISFDGSTSSTLVKDNKVLVQPADKKNNATPSGVTFTVDPVINN